MITKSVDNYFQRFKLLRKEMIRNGGGHLRSFLCCKMVLSGPILNKHYHFYWLKIEAFQESFKECFQTAAQLNMQYNFFYQILYGSTKGKVSNIWGLLLISLQTRTNLYTHVQRFYPILMNHKVFEYSSSDPDITLVKC